MNPSTLIFLGLAVVWAVVLLPEAVRKLSATRSSDSIRSFNHQLSVLHRANPDRTAGGHVGRVGAVGGSNVIDLRSRSSVGNGRSAEMDSRPVGVPLAVRRRRQEILSALAAVAILTLLCTVAFGSAFLIPHVVADVLLVSYVVILSQVSKTAQTAPRRNVTSSGVSSTHTFRPATVSNRVVTSGASAAQRVAN